MSDERDDLDGVRIQQIAALRRSLHRIRSYCLIGLWGSLGAAAQCAWLVAREIRRQGLDLWAGLWAVCIIPLLLLALYFLRKSRRLLAAARQSIANERQTPAPDFSTLSDGSQIWKSLQ